MNTALTWWQILLLIVAALGGVWSVWQVGERIIAWRFKREASREFPQIAKWVDELRSGLSGTKNLHFEDLQRQFPELSKKVLRAC